MPAVDWVVPGNIATRTGGYIYDRRILEGLENLGWRTAVHSLDESFPRPAAAALREARGALAAIESGRIVVIDGLALAGLERVLDVEAKRLSVVGLIHHPLALETGLDEAAARALERAERSALAVVRRVVVTSQWTARFLGTYRVPIAHIRVVEPGTDRRAAPRVRRESHDPLNLLCVGTLTARKGHAVLIEALADLRERRWHLVCAGSLTRDPATVEDLNRRITRLRLTNRISMVGELAADALERYYERADVFVLASYLEGYGMALAEAIARGIPVVSTTAGAIPETVPAAASILVRPGDSRALAKALAGLMDDPPALAALARQAHDASTRLPSWSEAATRFATALDGLGTDAVLTGFTAEWLHLREPLDAASRDATLVEWLPQIGGTRHVVDLGAGTGANLRYLAPLLGGAQEWLLVDDDAPLLAAADDALFAWAMDPGARMTNGPAEILIAADGFECCVRRRRLDLAAELHSLPLRITVS